MERIDPGPYDDGMNRVFAFIDDHLADDLCLSVLSRVSGNSPSHFHRIFHAMAGKTLRAYVLDRRIYAAARRLMYDGATLTRIALDCGFGSSSSFVRCFRREMGCSPSQYRRNHPRRRPPDTPESLCLRRYPVDPALDALFSTVTLANLHAAGIVCQGLSRQFQSTEIEHAFRRLFLWLSQKNLLNEETQVTGITLDTPEVASFAECRYFACVPVEDTVQADGGVSVRSFPTAGMFLQFSLNRTMPDFAETFFHVTDYLYARYMPDNGWIPDNRPFVEFYTQESEAVVIRFCVPVKQQEKKSNR